MRASRARVVQVAAVGVSAVALTGHTAQKAEPSDLLPDVSQAFDDGRGMVLR